MDKQTDFDFICRPYLCSHPINTAFTYSFSLSYISEVLNQQIQVYTGDPCISRSTSFDLYSEHKLFEFYRNSVS